MIYQLSIFSLLQDVTIVVTTDPKKILERVANPNIYQRSLMEDLDLPRYWVTLWKEDGTWIENVPIDEFEELHNGNG